MARTRLPWKTKIQTPKTMPAATNTRRVPAGAGGFTLVELIVVITLIALFSMATIISLRGNDQIEGKTEKEIILTDLLAIRQDSLLLKKSAGKLVFKTGERGYQVSYPVQTGYGLALEAVETAFVPLSGSTGPEYRFRSKTTNNNAAFDLAPAAMVLYARNSKSSIAALNTNYNAASQVSLFSLTGTDNLDTLLTFYFQDPNNPQNKSNLLNYVLFSPRNRNAGSEDDIQVKQVYKNTTVPIPEGIVSFDGFGKILLTDPAGSALTNVVIELERVNNNPRPNLDPVKITLPDDI